VAELYDPAPTFMDFGLDLCADYRSVVSDPWKLCESDLIKIACPALRRAIAAEAEVARLKAAPTGMGAGRG
jgi:hypothetical protein